MKINYNNSIERNYYNIKDEIVERFNSLEATLEFDEETEVYRLYVAGDCIDENKNVNQLDR